MRFGLILLALAIRAIERAPELETKSLRKRQINQQTQRVKRLRKSPLAAKQNKLTLLASSKLPERKIRQVLLCYADGKSPKEARQISGLSHVSIYRLYGYIRQRLVFVGLYRSADKFIAEKEQDEQEGPYFSWDEYMAYVRKQLGAHRGVKRANRELYIAQTNFRFEGKYTAAQFYRLLLLVIKTTGPLNRTPARFDPATYYKELFRLTMLDVRRSLRQAVLSRERKQSLHAAFDGLDARTDDFVEKLEAAQRDTK